MAGTGIGSKLKIEVSNAGTGLARGTASPGNTGYMVDILLTRGAMPEGFAVYSESYYDGVLLRGGRISNTASLKPGARRSHGRGGWVPADTPAGTYRLCARVDPGQAVAESNEGNNVACTILKVAQPELTFMQHVVAAGTEPATPHVQRTALPDGRLRQRRPDGKVVTIAQDGRRMVPYVLQAQSADLPSLRSQVTDSGTRVNTELLNILLRE